ncbi:MAG: CBS domain-containing protein [Steroidobacteraceae bacterium]|jgi:CBS domain-containing protein|nr:CBS domain-containing protein [Steroidobacteraceae bacterium]
MDPDTRVRRLMTEPVLSVELDARPSEMLRLLAGYPVHHLPVVDGGRLVGMVSDADLRKLDGLLPHHGDAGDAYLDSRITIGRLMTHPVLAAGPDEPVGAVAARMVRAGVHAVPVVDAGGRLVGILTTTDIIDAALRDDAGARTAPAADPAASPSSEGLRALRSVLQAADRYLRGGQDEALHAQLLLAVEAARVVLDSPAAPRGALHSY